VRDRITIAALETETAYELEREPYGQSRARKATDPIPGPQVHVSGRFGNLKGFHSRAGRSATLRYLLIMSLFPLERCAKVPRVELDIERRAAKERSRFPLLSLRWR
jgi:hypothetical protein